MGVFVCRVVGVDGCGCGMGLWIDREGGGRAWLCPWWGLLAQGSRDLHIQRRTEASLLRCCGVGLGGLEGWECGCACSCNNQSTQHAYVV